MHEALRRAVRVAAGRPADPSVGIADSQGSAPGAAKSTEKGGPAASTRRSACSAAGRRRRRHILVDTLGLLIATRVEPANLHGSRTRDQRGARALLGGLRPLQPRLAVVYADAAYAGAPLRDWCAARVGVELRVVRRARQRRTPGGAPARAPPLRRDPETVDRGARLRVARPE